MRRPHREARPRRRVPRCPGVEWTRRPTPVGDTAIDLVRAVGRLRRPLACRPPFGLTFLIRLISRRVVL